MYDWTAKEEGGQVEELPNGTHGVTLTRIVWAKRDGTELTSRSGLPQAGFVLADAAGREGIYWASITNGPVAWPERSLSGLMRALTGIDPAKLNEAGIMPEQFLNRPWAEKQLLGRAAVVKISRRTAANGKEYVTVEPTPATPSLITLTPAAEKKIADTKPIPPHQPVGDDDIPF